jgi:exodeoxyribonuclease VII large subunit
MQEQAPILTVSELNGQTKSLLEREFGIVQITGEISNWIQASSGHCYFSLKDEQAQVRCACFRGSASRLRFSPENGLSVVLTAQVSLYPNRGEYQLIVSRMQPAGQGLLALQFEKLKKKLAAEGLFDEDRKQPIPALPHRIAVVTSPTGAALQDIKKVLARRFPLIPITVYPSLVQGKDAPASLRNALQQAEADERCEVIILARGGGSIEDLWGFNDEALARLMATCETPIICGVGHEVDFTIADFVADLRAATPSAAAEQAVPDQDEFFELLLTCEQNLRVFMRRLIENRQAQLRQLQARLIHPKQLLQNQMQRLDYAQQQLLHAIQKLLLQRQNQLQTLAAVLEQQSPLKLLQRGYTVLRLDEKPVTSVKQTQSGDTITAELKDGALELTVC